MKTNISGSQHPTHPQTKPVKRPENKDALDSREGEEQSDKGDDVTHNEKENTESINIKIKNSFTDD
jgi:hypothetical protein